MDASASSIVAATAATASGTVQGASSMPAQKNAMSLRTSLPLQLIDGLPKPASAPSGDIGTQLDTFA